MKELIKWTDIAIVSQLMDFLPAYEFQKCAYTPRRNRGANRR
jgi:hypothetical protein